MSRIPPCLFSVWSFRLFLWPEALVESGLAVCRTVVKKAGGTLDVEASEDLGGARFTLSIPRRV